MVRPPASTVNASPACDARKLVIALPKRSTCRMRPSPAPSITGLASDAATVTSDTACPTSASPRPDASTAATGAIRSRPWNVRDTSAAANGVAPMSAAASPAGSGARAVPASGRIDAGSPLLSTPVSGPTSQASAVSIATSRRALPTPGSTTITCTLPGGKPGQALSLRNRAGGQVAGRDGVAHIDDAQVRL